jgi:UDP-N-acetylmuramate--alanine ligase
MADADRAEVTTHFFCGIGGSGMSALAQALCHYGHRVHGSDRGRDRGQGDELYGMLEAQGVVLYPQDGSGVDEQVDEVIVSSAVEETIPDVRAARALGIPIRRRAELLAERFNRAWGVAVGGTSGKTTVTGMVGHILKHHGRDPTVINGGPMLNATGWPYPGNALCGDPGLMVVEADESDGTIALYEPEVSVLTTVSLDHKPLAELRPLFRGFCEKAKTGSVVNADCAEALAMADAHAATVTFGIESADAGVRAEATELLDGGARFRIGTVGFDLKVPGRHNVLNALAAVAACKVLDIPVRDAAAALSGFLGIQRRLEILGEAGGVTVIDDFAHNPEKLSATLSTLRERPGRLLLYFQPTGFAPTRLLKEGLIRAFSEGMGCEDLLVMPEIYYAGGTAQKDISSRDLIEAIVALGRRAEFIPDRDAIAERFVSKAEPGDRVVVMGARDATLSTFAQEILHRMGGDPP